MHRVWKNFKETILSIVLTIISLKSFTFHWNNKIKNQTVVLTVLKELLERHWVQTSLCFMWDPGRKWLEMRKNIFRFDAYILKPVSSRWLFNNQTDVVIIMYITIQQADHSFYFVIILGVLYNFFNIFQFEQFLKFFLDSLFFNFLNII